MNIKHTLTVLGLSCLALFAQAKTLPTQVTVKTELASPVVLVDEAQPNYLKVSLVGDPIKNQTRVPVNLALVIDRSGSMSGDRIEKARQAAIMAINMLNQDDMVSVIAYDSDAKIVIPATKVVNKTQLITTINQKIQANGMTALFAGLSKGINQVDKYLDKSKVNRIILLSDGQANVGPTSVNELAELAKIAAKKGIAITTIGLGDDYNEKLMASIASYSDGNHAFVEKSADLEAVFVNEFKDVMSVVAQEVTVTITLHDGVTPIRLLGREGDIDSNTVTVKMNQLYANQEKYVLLEIVSDEEASEQQKTIADVTVSYEDLVNQQPINYQDYIILTYTDQEDDVKKNRVEAVLAESEIQKVTLENEKALQLYNQGNITEAKELIIENANKLKVLTSSFASPEASSRALEQAEKNEIMADSIDEDSSDVYLKKATEFQFDSRQSTIKQK